MSSSRDRDESLDDIVPPGSSIRDAFVLMHEERIGVLEAAHAAKLHAEALQAARPKPPAVPPLANILPSNVNELRREWQSAYDAYMAGVTDAAVDVCHHLMRKRDARETVAVKCIETLRILQKKGFKLFESDFATDRFYIQEDEDEPPPEYTHVWAEPPR